MIITCEHGGNEVPAAWATLFDSPGARRDLNSHRGYDPGAFLAAAFLATKFKTKLIASTTTRLLCDLNRSEDNDGLWSKYSRDLNDAARSKVLSKHYRPYRDRVAERIRQTIDRGDVAVHLSIHTFTPLFRGTRRTVDVGILFDPARTLENKIASDWIEKLQPRLPNHRVTANEPYLGTDDGLSTYLRTQFDAKDYVGIEVEITNRFAGWKTASQQRLLASLETSFNAQP